MKRLIREESGIMLLELLLAAALMTLVLGATVTSLSTFENTSRINELQNDNQEDIRAAVDQISRELRNHAVATQDAPVGIVKMTDTDLVFQTVAPTKPASTSNAQNVSRIRYCLDYSKKRNEVLWSQEQTWTTATPPAVPSTSNCPDNAWGNQRFIADKITNRFQAGNPNQDRSRAVFTANSASIGQITRISITLWLDSTPGGGPANAPDEAEINSGIFLRNQNQPPTSVFTTAVTGSRHIILNASDSNDPENQSLTYTWKDGSTALDVTGQTGDFPATSGSHTISLTVRDPGGLSTTSSQTVTVP
ncbi:MAG TPA: PKD domain-containing protein [Thermoleophilaceae bacterium]|nr:PKD domain-containing protein [Thermoleophilaceae bacterium]